jgi:hypothetical protein
MWFLIEHSDEAPAILFCGTEAEAIEEHKAYAGEGEFIRTQVDGMEAAWVIETIPSHPHYASTAHVLQELTLKDMGLDNQGDNKKHGDSK